MNILNLCFDEILVMIAKYWKKVIIDKKKRFLQVISNKK